MIQTVFDQIGKVVEAAKITAYEPNQIDVTHRTTYRPTASIIIMFDMKKDRNNVYWQKMEIKSFKSSDIVNQRARDQDEAPVQNI